VDSSNKEEFLARGSEYTDRAGWNFIDSWCSLPNYGIFVCMQGD